MLKHTAMIVIPILLFLLQQSFLPASPFFFPFINLILIYCLLLLLLNNYIVSLYNALILGVFMDIYSPHVFGLYIISFMFAIIVTYIFLTYLFTNKSIYAFIFLTAIATITFQVCYQIILITSSIFTTQISINNLFTLDDLLIICYENIVNIVFMVIIFYIINYFSVKLKPFFIASR